VSFAPWILCAHRDYSCPTGRKSAQIVPQIGSGAGEAGDDAVPDALVSPAGMARPVRVRLDPHREQLEVRLRVGVDGRQSLGIGAGNHAARRRELPYQAKKGPAVRPAPKESACEEMWRLGGLNFSFPNLDAGGGLQHAPHDLALETCGTELRARQDHEQHAGRDDHDGDQAGNTELQETQPARRAAAANRALERLGKTEELALFVERLQHTSWSSRVG
jgi:hypothetical protein